MMSRWRWPLALLTFVVATGVSIPLVFEVALALAPNRTADGHLVMATGQAAIATVLGPLLGLVAATVVFRKARAPRPHGTTS